jgi:hypothetical protein
MARRRWFGVFRWLKVAGALSVLLTAAAVGPSGSAGQRPPAAGPTIKVLIPKKGFIDEATLVRIKGKNLSAHGLSCSEPEPVAPCEVSVRFGPNPARLIYGSPREDIVLSPTVATPETVEVTVTVSGVASNTLPFTYQPTRSSTAGGSRDRHRRRCHRRRRRCDRRRH